MVSISILASAAVLMFALSIAHLVRAERANYALRRAASLASLPPYAAKYAMPQLTRKELLELHASKWAGD